MKPLTKGKKKIVALVILIALAVAVSFLSVSAVNHFKGPVRLVNRYVDAVNNQDAQALTKCFPPSYQETVKSLISSAGGDRAFFQQTYSGMFESETPYDTFGENVIISVSDPQTESETITDGIFRGLNVSQLEVTAVSTVTCTMTTKGSLREVSEQVEVVCIKIDRSWYLLNMSAITQDPAETPTDVQ